MRSFSSIVCAMLGQHPDMYGMSELNLFISDTLEGVKRRHERFRPHTLHGLLRALAQLHWGAQTDENVEEAYGWVREHAGWSTKRVLDFLRQKVAPRVLIDKSPSTATRPEFLHRAYSMYPRARFLHLTRHPRSMGNSVIRLARYHMPQWNSPGRMGWFDPERIWLRAHENILRFSDGLAPGQYMRIRGEDFMADPTAHLIKVSGWLRLRSDDEAIQAMKRPQDSPYACLGPRKARYGQDPMFMESPELRPTTIREESLEGEMEWRPGHFFSPATIELAHRLGYE